ncbi:MAG: hypothetical protein DLM73_13145 [Chthoniobacterales bacterium]|nr:MAG: hypothetical protein DLM73_13145 [Chthoniobacterales bacterium]
METAPLSPNDSKFLPSPAALVRCAVCSTPLAAGQCPRCLLSLGSSFGLPGDEVAADDLLDPMQVRRFGDYELLGEIARGGMGVVYRARQISLNREVAVKMILAGELAGEAALRLFQNEAHAAANLHHPNIVPVYEIGERETQHYFTMRFVPGGQTIADWARGQGEDYRAIAGAVARVARAVAYAHERGVLHRDLKPSNVLWDPVGEPQVTDFGLAKVLASADGMATFSAQALGSPSYMAPEQMNGRTAEITTATDVYGIGAVLYELLAGKPPFAGDSALETMRRAAEESPRPLTRGPKDLRTICLKCLEKKQPDRYRSAAALADDLERFVRGEPVSAVPLTPPQVLLRWAARKPRVAALLALFLASLVFGITGIAWQWRRTEHARVAQERAVNHLRWEEIAREAGTDEAPIALAKLAAVLRADPGRWQAAMLAMSIVNQGAFPVLAGPPVLPGVKLTTPPALAPDGNWFAVATADGSVRVWDVATGRERQKIALEAPATTVAVTQGPFALAIATSDGKLTVHTTPEAPGTSLALAGTQAISKLHFSADGSHLATLAKDRVEVWNCTEPALPPTILQLDGEMLGCAISADGARVLTWTASRGAVWDVATGQEIFGVAARKDFHRGGALSANGKRFALLDGIYAARVWDIDSGQQLADLDHPLTLFLFAALNADGSRITLSGNANDLAVYDTVSHLVVSPPMQHLYQPKTLLASSDGRRTVSQGWDGRACVWDATSGRSVLGAIWLETGLSDTAVDLSRDGRTVLLYPEKIRGTPGTISVWRGTRTQPSQRHYIDGARDFSSNLLSPDGRLGCIGLGPHYGTQLYELATGRVVFAAQTKGDVYIHLFSPDMRSYYTLTENGWLYGWSLETGQPLWPPSQQPGLVRAAEISPDGNRIIAGYSDGHIRIHDTATGKVVRTLDDPPETRLLRFAPDGSGRFLVGSNQGAASIWQMQTGQKLHTLTGHTAGIITGGWSRDGKLVATGSYDRTVRVWDSATGRPVGRPMQHLAGISHLEFSPDGRQLLTGSRNATARLWNPLTGDPLSPPLPQASTVLTVRFTQDGACFLVRDHLGFQFWDTEKAEPITVHYSEPMGSGLGMDSAPWRAIMSPDGKLVHLGMSMNYAALWTVSQPRTSVPAWFPDFLEGLALMRLDSTDSTRISSGDGILALKKQLRAGGDDPYATWARRVLQEK